MSVASMNKSNSGARRTALRILAVLSLAGAALAATPSGCATQTISVPTRALERSGRVSFVCLGDPNKGDARRPLAACNATTVLTNDEYLTADDAGPVHEQPHLYALVTQTTRGEVAVIDTTSANNFVLDQDPTVPGANFLPIGAQPIDIVSTPGGTATFVGVAEVGREGIYALPSSKIRPQSSYGTGGAGGTGAGTGPDGGDGGVEKMLPEISSWPSCRLPAAPGRMLLVPDVAAVENTIRDRCELPAHAFDPTAASPTIDGEGHGRQKLIVTLPSLGAIAVIDAQALLELPPGEFSACPKDGSLLSLSTVVPQLPEAPPFGGVACVDPKSVTPAPPATTASVPTGLAYAAGRLYVSDLETPAIHVIDMPTPCDLVEKDPLLPTSLEDPKRVVTTSHVAVAPSPTPALKRYLYAVDALDGSAMVFDVSDDQASRFPLKRPDAVWDPFTPADRIRFAAPAADLVIAQRDLPEVNLVTGTAPSGIRCDPTTVDANGACTAAPDICDLARRYRTDTTTYTSGAGPKKLRGTFAFLALTNGNVAVVDIDDYDAACRGPMDQSSLLGCSYSADKQQTGLATAKELSCNVVLPNTPRMGTYYSDDAAADTHQSGIVGLPTLFDLNGAPIGADDPKSPRMIATIPAAVPQDQPQPLAEDFKLSVSGSPIVLDMNTGLPADPALGGQSTLILNAEDPRAQLVDQNWVVTYEGALPGFDQKLGELRFDATGTSATFVDATSRFCDAGVQSEKAVAEKLGTANSSEASGLADYVHIETEIPAQDSVYFNPDDKSQVPICTYDECRAAFGTLDVPTHGRDFRITEAYQDHAEVVPREPGILGLGNDPKVKTAEDITKCCFPSLVAFSVRVGQQWEVAGDQSGFLHHVIPDPATGVCRDSCDPTLVRKNGRARRVPNPATDPRQAEPVVSDGAEGAFINPMFRFAVRDPLTALVLDKNGKLKPTTVDPVQGQQFRFTTQGSFTPLFVTLSPDTSTMIQPVGMTFVPSTGGLAVTDGSINGLLLIDLSSSSVIHRFF